MTVSYYYVLFEPSQAVWRIKMAIIFLCAVVFCVALAFAAAFGRRIEGTLALSVMFLISLLYF